LRYDERTVSGTADPRAKVTVELITGTPVNAAASAAGTVLAKYTVYAAPSGRWVIGLKTNESLTPTNTRYKISEYNSGGTAVNYLVVTPGTTELVYESNMGAVPEPTFSVLTLAEGANVIAGTATGTKIGTSASQKLGFYNATPIVKPTGTPVNATDLATAQALVNDLKAKLIALGLIA
jgi:hypothetical protein